jgi:tight adherence protein C
MLAQLVSIEDVVPFAIFGAFATLAWLALNWLAAGTQTRASERLDEFTSARGRNNPLDRSRAAKKDKVSRVLERATPALARALEPKNEAELGRLKSKLAYAGFRSESAKKVFLSLKIAGLLAGLFFAGGAVLPFKGFTINAIIWVLASGMLLFYLPDAVVWWIGRGRKENVFLGLPDALDLMVVCVEAGLGLDQAMRKVSEEMKKTYRVVAEEFALSNFQLQMGRPRSEVLHELGDRTGVRDLRTLATVLIQADKFGSSVAAALRTQSDAMRVRRRQLAEEKAAKTAVKLIFPLVLFIFPGIFVILVGPAAIQMMNNMFSAMEGQ